MIWPEPIDKLMKYYYGFQTTKLGKIFIYQNYKTIEDFYKSCAENFVEYFFGDRLGMNDDDVIKIKYTSVVKNNVCILINDDFYIEEFEEWDKNKSSWTIEGDIFIVEFGDNTINMEYELEKYKIDIEMLKLKNVTRKYNL